MNLTSQQMYYAIQEDRMPLHEFIDWLEERDQDQYNCGYEQAEQDAGEDL